MVGLPIRAHVRMCMGEGAPAQVPGTHDKCKHTHAGRAAAAPAAPVLQFCMMCLQHMHLQHKCGMCACAANAHPPVCSPATAAAGQWTAGCSSGCACTTATNSHAIPSNKHAVPGRVMSVPSQKFPAGHLCGPLVPPVQELLNTR